MKSIDWLRVAICLGMVAGTRDIGAAQPADPKPATSANPTGDSPKGPAKETPKVSPSEKPAAPPVEAAPAMKAELDAWTKAAAPGPMHAWLARGIGTWDAKVMMLFPGQPSAESSGTMVIEMMLGGRYQRGLFSGEVVGRPFQGVGITGYNNMTGKFEGMWMDNFTTATMFSTGALEGDKLVMTGEMHDPTIGKAVKQKQVFRFVGNDKMTAEFFNEMDGKDVPVMTITYTRSAAKPPTETKPATDTPKEGAHEGHDAAKTPLPTEK